MSANVNKMLEKIGYVALTFAGTGLTVFNVLAFKVSKGAIYYPDGNQTWAMVGVLLILAGYFLRNWKKL